MHLVLAAYFRSTTSSLPSFELRQRRGYEDAFPEVDMIIENFGSLLLRFYGRNFPTGAYGEGSKRIAHAHLRAEKIQAGIGIGLPAIREMLIKRAHAYLPVIVHQVGNSGCR